MNVVTGFAQDLSPWGMFLQADIVVKGVMILLAGAALFVWIAVIAKRIEITRARRSAARAAGALMGAETLAAASSAVDARDRVARALIGEAADEIARTPADLSGEGAKARVALRLARIEAKATREIGAGVGLLATVGAIGPFVGLFGTVWGIMNAFVGIAKTQTTNLAVVAPGIAEALLATAIGLVAAIPAVVFYNILTRAISGYRGALSDASALVALAASREIDARARGSV